MTKRKIINIDHAKCNGCGLCIPNCPEGAIQMIDGKARLISDLFCDGLGACLGTCPVGAITIEEREAKAYEEHKVMENIVKQGANVIKAHLDHLSSHGEKQYLKEALNYLEENKHVIPSPYGEKLIKEKKAHTNGFTGCPGMKMINFESPAADETKSGEKQPSALRQWPVQLHLVSPNAPYFQGKDVVLAADCVAFALGDFHSSYLAGKSLAIACPKLDSEQEIYVEKVAALIDNARINTLTVMIMEVPCCRGLLRVADEARKNAARKIPLKLIVVGIKGNIISEEWI